MKQLNRHILKLLMLFVGLFAISNVGWADGTPGLMGAGWTTANNWDYDKVDYQPTYADGWHYWNVTANSTAMYFRIRVKEDFNNNDNQYGPKNNNDVLTNGVSYTSIIEYNNSFKVNTTTNKSYRIWYNHSSKDIRVTWADSDYPGIVGEGWNGASWNTPSFSLTREGSGNWYYKDITPTSSIVKFRIRYWDDGLNREFQHQKNNEVLSVENGEPYDTWGKKRTDGDNPNSSFQIPNPDTSVTYRIWFNIGNKQVKVTWNDSKDPGDPAPFILRGDWNNWSSASDQTYRFKYTEDPNVVILELNSFNIDDHFRLYNSQGSIYDYDGNLIGKNMGEWWDGDNHNYRIDNGTYTGGKLIFELLLNDNGTPKKLNIFILPTFSNNTSRGGKAYLVGNVINNNTPSPAWELTGTSTNKTLSNFAMRFNDNNLGVVEYNASGVPTYYEMSRKVTQPTKEVGGAKKRDYYSQAGWTYSASWNGSTLTLTPSTFNVSNNILPYVGILGGAFKQKEAISTYYAGSNGWPTHPERNARDGWQEAYIEYGANGAPIKKQDGHAYYNTVWPPKHNILMQAELENEGKTEILNVTSSELSLKPDASRQTGSAWIEDLYGTAQNVKNEEYEGLKLEAGRTYARYIVKNMWMQGPFKIWTGWGGQEAEWKANWDTHIYWGPTDAKVDGNKELKVKANETYDAKNDGDQNNYLAQNRAFFQTMELFIPVDDTNGFDFNAAKLYMTEAPGGAQIDAVANNAEVGCYPSITNWPTDYKMTSYRITRYAYDASIPSEKFADELWACTRKRDEAQYGSSAATVKTHDYGSYENGITEEEFKALFANFWKNGGDYVLEGTYDPGRYIFRLEVTFANQENNKTKSADVWSPYVEIITTGYTTDLDTYQLIELPAGNKYTYMTYDLDGNYRGVNLKDDGESVASIESLKLSDDDAQEILEITGKWTNKVLFISRVPVNFEQQTADLKEIRSFTVVDGNDANTKILDLKPYEANESYYMAVKNLSTDLNLKEYKSAFTGYIELEGENNTSTFTPTGTMDEPIEYYPHFMLPAFGKALLSFDAEGNKTKEFTASHEDITTLEGTETQQEGITTNRHMLQADIEVLMPNISTAEGNELKTAVFNALSFNISKNDPDGGASISYPIVANDTKSEFGLSYKYQNPYDWMEYAEGQGIDRCDWVGKTHEWTITNAKYDSSKAISGITPTLNGQTATIEAKPAFKAPEVPSNPVYGFDIQVDEVTKWLNFDVWIEESEIGINNGDNFDTNDDTEVMMVQDKDVAFMVKVVLPEKYLNEDQDLSIISQVMPYKTANDPTERHSILHLYRWDDKNFYSYINELMAKLQIEVAYAYYFSAGGEAGSDSDDAGDNAKISTSNYIGLSSTAGFPNIRYDHQDGQNNGKKSVKRRAEGEYSEENPSETLTTGDNAFLLAPQYTVIKYADDTDNGIPTGIEGIGYDNAGSIRTGQGFIEVEGQSVAIYNASGICIATAEGRYDVAPGVYVVRLNGATSKVLVK